MRSALQERLARVSLPTAARVLAADDWHLTLAFLGTVPESARPGIESLLKHWPALPPLVLDRLEHWADSRVAALVATQTPAAWNAAELDFRAQLRSQGLRVDSRPWLPHVTLARAVDCLANSDLGVPIEGGFSTVVLAESLLVPGLRRYAPLAAHPLI
jgi:2'-5' RNA ligase